MPALLIAILAYFLEKLFTKIIPGILRTVFVGMLTMGITYVAAITILGPLGDLVGGKIVHVFLWASSTCGPVAIALLAACMPWLVMTGMHHAVTPFMVQAFADPGYDVFFRPSYILHNMAEGGACLGVALRTKNKNFRAECFSLAFGCIVAGVTEPALYGVNFRLKKPMIGIMAGAAAGGVAAGAMGATAYVYGYSTILALPIFQDTMMAMLTGIIIAILVSAIVTFILGFEDVPNEANANNGTAASKIVDAEIEADIEKTEVQAKIRAAAQIGAPVGGTVIAREEIPDETFAGGILGDGVGIIPTEGIVFAPFDGIVETVAETRHSVGLTAENGAELLIHVGVDTVKMEGDGFECFVKEGDKIKKGQKLIAFDSEKIKSSGYLDTVAVLVTNSEDFEDFKVIKTGKTEAGDLIISL